MDVTHRTVSDRILAGASQALALLMKAHPAWAGRAVKPRGREAVRESAGLDGTDPPHAIIRRMQLARTLSV